MYYLSLHISYLLIDWTVWTRRVNKWLALILIHIMLHKTAIAFLRQITSRDILYFRRMRKVSMVALTDESFDGFS